jgi:HK97 family phage prohead protease
MSKINFESRTFKHFNHLVKEMNDEEGIVVAYANTYNNEDFDGDISMPGSFDKTINESFKKLRVFKDHLSYVELGVPSERPRTDDPIGLLTFTQFNLEKQVSRDMFSDIKLKLKYQKDVDLSIGFNVVKRDEKDRRRITEYALWEYSFLSNWGADPFATVQSAKSLTAKMQVVQFLTDAYNLPYNDIRLKNIESILESLDGNTAGKPLILDEPNELTDDQIKSLIKTAFKI